MPRGKFIMGALSVDRLEAYLGRKRNRLRLAGFGTFLPGPKMEGFRLAQNPTRAPWYISTYDVMGHGSCTILCPPRLADPNLPPPPQNTRKWAQKKLPITTI